MYMVVYVDWFVYEWNEKKELIVFSERGVTFEMIIECIEKWWLISVTPHWNEEKYPDQKILYCSMNNYIRYVPFKETKNVRHLITIIPSRKLSKKFL
jgi:uncharacterized DUF497 family protein